MMIHAGHSSVSSSNALRYVFSAAVLKRNASLALIVGCLLTLANQLDILLSQPFTSRMGTKIFLNFVIPFVVSSISAAINRKRN
jgi:hypothetical protein